MEKKFTNHDAIELAQERSFIRWVKQTDEASTKFWEQWLSDHPDKKATVEEARRMVLAIRFKETPIARAKVDQLWSKIEADIKGEASISSPREAIVKPLARRRVIYRWMPAAAAAIVLLIGFWFFYNPATAVNAEMGETLAYELPDESTIQLNAGSTIRYTARRWNEARTVKMTGEAFFEVTKGSPFTVITPNGRVEVLGTSFNVFARDNVLRVTCFTGKVRVSSNEQEVVLTSGLSTKLDENRQLVTPETIPLEQAATWRSGQFTFENKTLGTVFAELERQFNVEVKAPAEVLEKAGTYFFENDNLEEALKKICYPLQLNYDIQGRRIVIRQ